MTFHVFVTFISTKQWVCKLTQVFIKKDNPAPDNTKLCVTKP